MLVHLIGYTIFLIMDGLVLLGLIWIIPKTLENFI